jgi:hypothetical protein
MDPSGISRRRFHAAILWSGSAGLLAARLTRGEQPADSGTDRTLGPGARLGGLRVFPSDNPWNQDVSGLPVDRLSRPILDRIGRDTPLHPDFGTVYQGNPSGIPYVVVPGTQPRVPVKFEYLEESDPGPYPIPADAPIEGGPNARGDRHVLVIDRDHGKLYELFAARPDGDGSHWEAGSGAIFDLNSNHLRPAGWTSADAAGLPVFPGLVRYDEVVVRKTVEHAFRFTVRRTRRGYVAPARHFASRSTDIDLPPMGMRVRLNASYNVRAFPAQARVILEALKSHGMILADNGSDWYLSGAPDPRWDDEDLATLKRVKVRDFEVVTMGPVVTR